MISMKLSTYQSCTFTEKRAVLRAFWSGRADESGKVNRAAREYGPYAFAMIAAICAELVVISGVLIAKGSAYAWLAVAATTLSLLSLWWTRVCQRAQGRASRPA